MIQLPILQFPKADLTLSKQGEIVFIWCIVRKKRLRLTPEEFVRQHLIHFLVHHKNVPLALISSEHTVVINNQSRRCDVVVFSKTGNPLLIVECKAPEIKLSELSFLQISNYIQALKAPYFMMTNGKEHVQAVITSELIYLNEIPSYEEMIID